MSENIGSIRYVKTAHEFHDLKMASGLFDDSFK